MSPNKLGVVVLLGRNLRTRSVLFSPQEGNALRGLAIGLPVLLAGFLLSAVIHAASAVWALMPAKVKGRRVGVAVPAAAYRILRAARDSDVRVDSFSAALHCRS